MGGAIVPHAFAVACGTGGAYTDVSSYVEFGETITYTYGRQDRFQDVPPGAFTFALNNQDGRFTPGNTASPYATPLVEGMGVSWLLGNRIVHGTILSFEIPADEAKWDHIVIHCDDMLGNAARFQITNLPDMLAQQANLQLLWRLDGSDSATVGAEASGALLGSFGITRKPSGVAGAVDPTFGVQQPAGLPGTAVTLTAAAGETVWYGTARGQQQIRTTIPYQKVTAATSTTSSPTFGWYGIWVYPGSSLIFQVVPHWAAYSAPYDDSMQFIVTPTGVTVQGGVNSSGAQTYTYTTAEVTAPHYLAMRPRLVWQSSWNAWACAVDLYIDGVSHGSTFMQSSNPDIAQAGYAVPAAMLADGSALQPVEIAVKVSNPSGAAGPLSGTFQRISHTLNGSALEYAALYNTLEQRRTIIDYVDPSITSETYSDGPLSTAPIGFPDLTGRSVLDAYNDIVRTEVGSMFCLTTGSLLNPTEQIEIRSRIRPATPRKTFDVTVDGDGLPALVRDLTNVVSTVAVQGPAQTVTVADPTVAAVTTRFLAGGAQETILSTDLNYLQAWGADRINRGKNTAINVTSFTVDAFTTPTDRSGDLLYLIPGDRIRITGFPAARVGYSWWDGWIIGGQETHGVGVHRFTFYLAFTLPTPLQLDTAGAALIDNGDITLTAAPGAADTSLAVTSPTGEVMTAGTVVTIEQEQVLVTAATATALTVTRGQNGTTAAAHPVTAGITVTNARPLAF